MEGGQHQGQQVPSVHAARACESFSPAGAMWLDDARVKMLCPSQSQQSAHEGTDEQTGSNRARHCQKYIEKKRVQFAIGRTGNMLSST